MVRIYTYNHVSLFSHYIDLDLHGLRSANVAELENARNAAL